MPSIARGASARQLPPVSSTSSRRASLHAASESSRTPSRSKITAAGALTIGWANGLAVSCAELVNELACRADVADPLDAGARVERPGLEQVCGSVDRRRGGTEDRTRRALGAREVALH